MRNGVSDQGLKSILCSNWMKKHERNVHVSFIDLKKMYVRVNREASC